MANKSLEAYYRAKAAGATQGTWGSAQNKINKQNQARAKATKKKKKKKEPSKEATQKAISPRNDSPSRAVNASRSGNRATTKNNKPTAQATKSAFQPRNDSPTRTTKSGAINSSAYISATEKAKKQHQTAWNKQHGTAAEAAKTSKKLNAQGTWAKTHTTGSKTKATGQLEKAAYRAAVVGEAKKNVNDWDSATHKEKKNFIKNNFKKDFKEHDKEVDKAKNTQVKAKDATLEEYQKLQNALRTGGGNGKTTVAALGDKTAKKFAALTAQDYQKSKASQFGQGLIEGASYVPTTKQLDSVYTQAEKSAIDEGEKSGAYMGGYVGGMLTQFGVSGIGTVGKALTKTGLKALGKNAAKTTKGKIAANVAGDVGASLPLDTIDAYKQSVDADGNLNKKEFFKALALNSVAFGGGGGALLEGASAGLTKMSAKKLINLQAKANVGSATADELKQLEGLKDKFYMAKNDEFASGASIADKAYTAAARSVEEARLGKRLGAKGVSPEAVRQTLAREDVANYLDLRAKEATRGLSEAEKQTFKKAQTAMNLQKIRYESALKTTIKETADDIKMASSMDVARLRSAVKYYESVGMKAEAKEASAVLAKAEKNFTKTVESVAKAADTITNKLGREFKIESGDEIIESFAKAGGQIDDPSLIHGYADFDENGNIISYHVNKDSEQAIEFTFGHELTHGFESLGKQYDTFKNALIKYAGDEWGEELEAVKRQYANVKNANFENEAVANLVGRHLFANDGKFLKHLAGEEPTLFERIYHMIKNLIKGTAESDRQLNAL